MNELLLRRRLGAAKPYDAEVEYLETDGLAYIDTGVAVNGTLEFETKMKTVPPSVAYAYLGGYLPNQSSTANRFFCVKNGGGKEQFSYGSSSTSTYNAATAIRTMSYKGTTYKIDNSSYSVTRKTFSFNLNFWILGACNYGNAGSGNRVYSFKLWDGGVLVRDYIPVRKGTVGYLYDTVSGTLFGNANSSGAFILGNDVTN